MCVKNYKSELFTGTFCWTFIFCCLLPRTDVQPQQGTAAAYTSHRAESTNQLLLINNDNSLFERGILWFQSSEHDWCEFACLSLLGVRPFTGQLARLFASATVLYSLWVSSLAQKCVEKFDLQCKQQLSFQTKGSFNTASASSKI